MKSLTSNIESNGHKQMAIDPATGDVEFPSSSSLRTSWNVFVDGSKGTSVLSPHAFAENIPGGPERQQEIERIEREAAEKRQWEEIDSIRKNEITLKAVTAIFLLLLKWFRVSRKPPNIPLKYVG